MSSISTGERIVRMREYIAHRRGVLDEADKVIDGYYQLKRTSLSEGSDRSMARFRVIIDQLRITLSELESHCNNNLSDEDGVAATLQEIANNNSRVIAMQEAYLASLSP